MAQQLTKSSHMDDADFGAHLQRRLGITSYELGECLTQYRPSRPYQIVIDSDAGQGSSLGDASSG